MAAEGALLPTPAAVGSVTGLVPAKTGGQPNAPSSGRFIRIHPMEAHGFRLCSGRCRRGQCPCWCLPARAARLGWMATQQFVALSPGRPILAAWTSHTTVWRHAPAGVSQTVTDSR